MLRWTLHLTGRSQRSCCTAVVVDSKVYCFDCFDREEEVDQRHDDPIQVHVFNAVSLRWAEVPQAEASPEVPSWRRGHTAVLIEDLVYIWGGVMRSLCCCTLLYAFDVTTHRWSQPGASGSVPGPRYASSACALGEVMYVHGGNDDKDMWHRYSDVYTMDTATMVWSLLNTGGTSEWCPPPSGGHSATIIGTKMFVFGGFWSQREVFLNFVRVFDTETDCWLGESSVLPYGNDIEPKHTAISYNGELYVIVRYISVDMTNIKNLCDLRNGNDLWKFNPETFSWRKVDPKGNGPAGGGSCKFFLVGERSFLYGRPDGWIRRRSDPSSIPTDELYVLDFSPSLKTLCMVAALGYGLEMSGLPHNIRWELAAMTTDGD